MINKVSPWQSIRIFLQIRMLIFRIRIRLIKTSKSDSRLKYNSQLANFLKEVPAPGTAIFYMFQKATGNL
jgi:hypothetical protein